jgi:formylglycine-generating enzyme
MKKLVMILVVLGLVNVASADIMRGIDIDFATIDNAGNAADFDGDGWYGYPSASGAVGYNYRIGTKEITADQWQTINSTARIGDSGLGSGDKPIAEISWYDAARFCNYLTTGNTEDGVYKFSDGLLTNVMDHKQAGSTYGVAYFLPTENEWYKAAYFKHDGSGYSLYANGTNTAPIAGVQSNYDWAIAAPWNVGTGTVEQNGIFDMMGNVWEWVETKPYDSYPWRVTRGGMFSSTDPVWDLSSYRLDAGDPDVESDGVGFRVASVPEPATLLLLGLGGLTLLRKHRA